MQKSIVSIVKGTDADRMVELAVDHLGGVKSLIRRGSTVVIKPNAGHEGAPETSVNTSPEVVAAVIRLVKQANPRRIILAESSAIGCETLACLESSGIKQAAEDAGVDEIRDIKGEQDLVKRPIESPTSDIKQVELPRFLLEADHLVNVPIFKSHVSMVFTCALKNLKGVVQDKHHYVMHCTNLANAMMDLGDVVRPDLTVVDMIRPMEGFGPHSGTPVEFDCVVAGRCHRVQDGRASARQGGVLRRGPREGPRDLRRGSDRDPGQLDRRGSPGAVPALPRGLRGLAGVQHPPRWTSTTRMPASTSCSAGTGRSPTAPSPDRT
jgi:uncharacterized protein (DUF362 family)